MTDDRQSRGGKATAERMTADQRKARSVAAALARWRAKAAETPEAAVEAAQAPALPEGKDWRDLTDKEREQLPLGSPGWRYERGTTIPAGQWYEDFREPVVYASGGIAWKYRWQSNGVGVPTMGLVGTTKYAKIQEHQLGWYPLAPGAYKPFKPNWQKLDNSNRKEADKPPKR